VTLSQSVGLAMVGPGDITFGGRLASTDTRSARPTVFRAVPCGRMPFVEGSILGAEALIVSVVALPDRFIGSAIDGYEPFEVPEVLCEDREEVFSR
jgi:hypothetical protein